MRTALFAAVLVFAGSACIIEAPAGDSKSAVDRARAAAPPVPPLQVKNGANLEDKIEVVGATVTPGAFLAGESVKVSAFFKVNQAIDKDYMIFVHVEDVDGKMERLNVDHHPGGGMYKTSMWKVGETVKDDFQVYIPPGSGARGINIYFGFWHPETDSRLKLLNPNDVRNDGSNRILLAQVPVK